ncbi:MAG: VWA domain-containing protein [Chitinophagaceae bacterium]|nr:VWA domain-containing protein [Chitinophagaceae bacterium]
MRWKQNVLKKAGDEKLVKALIKGYSAKRFFIKFFLVLLAFVAGVLAVMNPRQAGAGDKPARKGIDAAIALDVSKSMLASDYAPNRLERAKQFILKLLDKMPDDRIALILFAGKAYLQMPLTADHGAAKLFVSSATPEAVPQQGTVISDALEMSAKAFSPADKRFKAVILISDGEDHDENAVVTARELSQQGVMISSVGIGSSGRVNHTGFYYG